MTTQPTRSRKNPRSDDGEAFPRPFGNYILLMAFARGGMGEVYLAKRGAILGAEKYCVLKKLRPELTEDREYVARFIDEARVVVQLNHANICQVFDVGRVGSEYYLAMEYVSGRDVRSVQDRARNLELKVHEASVLYLLAETLSALDYAHRRTHPMTGEPLNLVHRDVSPQNIMVSFEGEVKLIDFGLASSRLKVERTQPNIVMGKMAYMAPEQARGDAIDKRADLFAAGVVGYELLAGERFYEGMSSQEIWYVVGRGGFVPSKWTDLSPDFARILAKALHPDPDSRYATCAEFRDAVMAYLHTRHPGLGERSLRELVQDLYAEEILRERDLLLGFAEVSGDVALDLLENTRSQSVSLAHAGELLEPKGGGARVVHDDRTQAGSGSLSRSAPKTQLTEALSDTGSGDMAHEDTGSGAAAVAQEHTLLEDAHHGAGLSTRTRTPPTGTITSGLAAARELTSLGVETSGERTYLEEGEGAEQTARVARAPFQTAATTLSVPAQGERRRLVPVLAAAAALVVVLAAGALLLRDDESDTSASSGAQAAATEPEGAAASDESAPHQPAHDDAVPTELHAAAIDGTPPEVTATDNAATDNAATDNAATDNAATDNAATDNAATDDTAPAEEALAASAAAQAAVAKQASEAEQAAAAERAARAERATEVRRAKEAKRAAAERAKEQREAAAAAKRAAAAEKAREKEARRAQARPRQQPREGVPQMVKALMQCGLPGDCSGNRIAPDYAKYSTTTDAAFKKSFTSRLRQCRKKCPR